MKTLLPIFLLLITAAHITAQKVVIKDSSVYSRYNSPYVTPYGVNTHTVNGFCKDSIVSNTDTKTLYAYNALQQNTDVLVQTKYSGTDTFLNGFRNIYTYTASGKKDTATLQVSTYFMSGILKNYTQTKSVYDTNDNLSKLLIYDWNTTEKSWQPTGENTYFNTPEGRLDSMYYYYFGNLDTSLVTYTYYTTGKLYQATRYRLNNGRRFNFITTSYYDSANYVSRDSSVTQTYASNSDSLFVEEIISNTHYYSTDGTQNELHTYHYLGDSVTTIINLFKTYYTYGNCFSVLPVTFLSFTAGTQNNNAVLHWTAGNNIRTSSFLVQRSTDGIHFTTLATVAGSGNPAGNLAYTYTDVNALLMSAPKLYYRLAEEDNNGSVYYSNIVSLSVKADKGLLTLLLNPVINTIKIHSSIAMSKAFISVSDMQGKLVYSSTQNIAEGSTIAIDASRFSVGMYVVTVQSALYKEQLKTIKQ